LSTALAGAFPVTELTIRQAKAPEYLQGLSQNSLTLRL
jgi:hypothetical protein